MISPVMEDWLPFLYRRERLSLEFLADALEVEVKEVKDVIKKAPRVVDFPLFIKPYVPYELPVHIRTLKRKRKKNAMKDETVQLIRYLNIIGFSLNDICRMFPNENRTRLYNVVEHHAYVQVPPYYG